MTTESRETHTPQISKAQVAHDKLTQYFVGFLRIFAVSATDEKIESTAAMLAKESYKIVKKAEGYEV